MVINSTRWSENLRKLTTKSILVLVIPMLVFACSPEQNNSLLDTEVAENTDNESIDEDGIEQLTDQPTAAISGDVLPFSKQETHVILGTGNVQGAYFPIGGVICRLLNRHKEINNVRCSLESTAGSVYNLTELREGNFGLVVSQSDWQYHAYNGSSTFEKEGPNKALRAVFALEADPITLIVKADSDINQLDDLADRVVSLGYTRSLQHRVIDDLFATMQWDDNKFKEIVRVSDPNQVEALCSDKVEAALFLMSSLNDYLRDLDPACELKFVPIESEYVDQVIAEKPYYRSGIIPAGKYLGTTEDIPSFGLGAVFVASEKTSVKAIYSIVKEVVENINDFRALHPSLQTIELNEMPYAGVAVPLHDGASRFYREARLLK